MMKTLRNLEVLCSKFNVVLKCTNRNYEQKWESTSVYPKVSGWSRYLNNNNNKHSLRSNTKCYDCRTH